MRSCNNRESQTTSAGTTSSSSAPSGQRLTTCSIVTGPAVRPRTARFNSARAQDGRASACPIGSGVLERTIARSSPHRCSVRNKRSSVEIPHSSTKALGLSARMTIGTAIAPYTMHSASLNQVEHHSRIDAIIGVASSRPAPLPFTGRDELLDHLKQSRALRF